MIDANGTKSRRQLLLRDVLSFVVLSLATALLFAVTLLLFRSFSAHRAELAERWAGRGKIALNADKPEEAVAALRTALEYAPGQRAYELMLAQALGASGHTDEATNYFLSLWETQPGDGSINLQLARLERQKHNKQDAIHSYRAAIYGTWDGDGVVHRRDARLELANYLIDEKDFAMAQTELLIAASNAPPEPGLELGFGDELLRAGDKVDALRYYQKSIAQRPRNALALDRAGRLAFQMGEYTKARGWLERAMHDSTGSPDSAGEPEKYIGTLLRRTDRLLALAPDRARTERDRIARILADSALAQKRFSACATQLGPMQQLPPAMQALGTQWSAAKPALTRTALLRDETMQDTAMGLTYDSELLTAELCDQPTGDDALLLLLAKSPHGQEP